MLDWFSSFRNGGKAANIRTVDVKNLQDALAEGRVPVLVDVRTPAEYASGHVPGARNLPLDRLDATSLEPYRDQEIWLICQSGGRSGRAATALSAAGFSTVNVAGGTGGWIQAGLPVER